MGAVFRWTIVAGIIGVILVILFAILGYSIFRNITDLRIDWVIGITIPVILAVFGFFWKFGSNIKKETMEYLLGLINNKADKKETEIKINVIMDLLKEHKENDKQNYDRLFEFITSIDHKLDTLLKRN